MSDGCTHTYHASRRAAERYGAPLTSAESDRVVMDITDTILGTRAAAVFVSRSSGSGYERWSVCFRDGYADLVYCPRNATVITLLSPVR